MKSTLIIPMLLLALVLLGSAQFPAAALDVSAPYPDAAASFADAVPLIPGYNAPYPFAATSLITGGGSDSSDLMSYSLYSPIGGFAATAPVIPGYNAAYPVSSAVITQD